MPASIGCVATRAHPVSIPVLLMHFVRLCTTRPNARAQKGTLAMLKWNANCLVREYFFSRRVSVRKLVSCLIYSSVRESMWL